MKIPLGKSYNIQTNSEGNIFAYGSFAIMILSLLFSGFSAFTVFSFLLLFSMIGFFRDPERVTTGSVNDIISGADGLVSAIIENVSAPEELDGVSKLKMTKISVFLSVFNVHVNRIPIDGRIIDIKYHAGKFLNASLDKSSDENERNSILFKTESGHKVVITQIAGLIARRIVCDAQIGSSVKAGDRYGIIKFGSRVDLYIPSSYKINVSVGQTVVGGETIMATMKK